MKILVIGDSCKDIYVYGKVDRLCPDAPVPVLIPKKTITTGGMASNVYENILSLGFDADIITNQKEIRKTRYVDEKTNHMFIRVDSENIAIPRISGLQNVNFKNYKAVIISDYNKGFLSYEDIEYICSKHNCVFVDTKKIINDSFKNAKFIKINEIEYNNNVSSGQQFEGFYEKMIITLSDRGCRYKNINYPVDKVQIKDNSGAGDTFISGLVVEYCRTNDINKAINYANFCATIVVQHKGVTKIGNHIN
jgi:bifunctional ADP-heptose synthase (sugar kinase/adenylyltransferase)